MTELISPDELSFLSQKNKEIEIESMMTEDLRNKILRAIQHGIDACKDSMETISNQNVEFKLIDFQVSEANLKFNTPVAVFSYASNHGKQIILIDKPSLDETYQAVKGYDGAKELDSVKLQNVMKYLERGIQQYYQGFSEYLNVPITVNGTESYYLDTLDEFTESNLDRLHEIKVYEIKTEGVQIQMTHLSDLDYMDHAYQEIQDSIQENISSHREPEASMIQAEAIQQLAQNVKKPLFSPLEEVNDVQTNHDLGLLHDVPLEISVVLGKTKRSIREILEINAGKIIELDKFADDPLEIYCNGKLIAEGEAVVIDGNFGVKVTKFFQNGIQNIR